MSTSRELARVALGAACCVALLVAYRGVAQAPATMPSAAAGAMEAPARTMLGNPYLKDWPPAESIALSPPPPAPESVAEARDVMASQAALALRGSPRWALATSDADLMPGRTAAAFACAAGVALGPTATPRTDRLLLRAMADLGKSTSIIKRAYQRPRPFMVNGQPTCTPDFESYLRKDGSYPSGHSAIGYGTGLILAQLIPDRAAQLVARGRAFGDSRRVCNVHWLSDTEEGRISAAATVARLNAEPAFVADLAAARKELRAARSAPQNCAAEAAALAG